MGLAMNDVIVIHVPKTGGTSLVMNLFGLDSPPPLSFHYRHFDVQDQRSNCADIFEHPEQYAGNTLIMMLRNPLERAESEYNFMGSRAEFRASFPGGFPESFEQFVGAAATSNGVLKFLRGRKIYSEQPVTEADYQQVISALQSLTMVYGLMERFTETLIGIEQRCGLQVSDTLIKQYRVAVYKAPRDEERWARITETFEENNAFDIRLFEWVVARFEEQSSALEPAHRPFKYTGSKYHSLMLYSGSPENRCPLNFFIPGAAFVQKHNIVLRMINRSSKKVAQGDGHVFAAEWVRRFSEHFKIEAPADLDPMEALEYFSAAVTR
jgi:hypothetical protein